jgi:hypothetical protein
MQTPKEINKTARNVMLMHQRKNFKTCSIDMPKSPNKILVATQTIKAENKVFIEDMVQCFRANFNSDFIRLHLISERICTIMLIQFEITFAPKNE